jgi:hypothetical protein
VKRERVTRAIGQVAVVVEVGVDQSEAREQSGTPLGTRTPCGSERRAQRRVRVEDHQGAGSETTLEQFAAVKVHVTSPLPSCSAERLAIGGVVFMTC